MNWLRYGVYGLQSVLQITASYFPGGPFWNWLFSPFDILLSAILTWFAR